MEEIALTCPLCCNKTFDSKETLLEHIKSTLDNLYCPICSQQYESIDSLTKHLSQENCSPDNEESKPLIERLEFEDDSIDDNNEFPSNTDPLDTLDNDIRMSTNTYVPIQNMNTVEDVNKMYVALMKPSVQSQELKLVKQSGDRYVIVTDNQTDFASGSIVTKQNQDGTISLTTVQEADPDTFIVPNNDIEPESSPEELYSCNTCGVSFSSVIEHIQNYHNNQDVVVEGSIDDNGVVPIELEYSNSDDTASSNEKTTSRRVITDNGDIVEAPFVLKPPNDIPSLELGNPIPTDTKEQQNNKKSRTSKRYIQVEKLCDSVIKDLKPDQKAVPYHKVTAKEAVTGGGKKVKIYTCLWCEVTVNSLAEFKQHPCTTLKYSCTQCTVSYDNAKSLCAHMKMHKVKTDKELEGPETFECECCGTVFPTNKSLKLHKRMHDPLKTRPIEEPVNLKSADLGRYKCNICDKMIPVAYKVIHQNSHKKDTTLNCGICNKKFSSELYLEMHMNVHNMEKAPQSKPDKTLPYSCLYCDRRFTRPHEKVKHERIHTGEKPHSCEICGKSFRVSYCLTLHMRTHTGARPYACHYCGKRFKAHSVYNHHLLTHSDVRAYKCPYCPKAFKTSVQLAGHKNSHTKPFSCTHCNRPFASLYAVRVHTETHARTNNLKYACALCGATYARAFALKDHVKQHHKEIADKDNLADSDWMTVKETPNENETKPDTTDLNKKILTSTSNEVQPVE